MAKFSVAICCANAADTLESACRSVAWADELVIVDSGSTDETAQIAQKYADQYIVEPWRGYMKQKQFATSLCRNNWVLVLDSDEECSPQLSQEISQLSDQQLEQYDVLLMPRHNYVMGRLVRAWGPDWQSRLIHRERCVWRDEVLHDARLPSHPSRITKLQGWLEHKRHSAGGFTDFFDGKLEDSRLMLVAQHMHQQGKRCGWSDIALRPLFAFIKFYILKRGFLDGQFGLLIAQKAAVGTHLKYAALWTYQQQAAAQQNTSSD